MFKLLGNKKLLLLLACLILFIALMGLTLGDRGRMTWPEKFVKDTVSFAQSLIYKPAARAAGFFDNMRSLRMIYEENAALKKKLNDYARDTARLNLLEDQVLQLEHALEFTDRQKAANRYRWHFAEVVSVNPDPLVRTVNINLGEKDGIRINMAVATADGLIGRVTEVSPFYSTVQLLSAIDYENASTKAIAATTLEHRESFGMIERYTSDGLLEMNKIQDSDLMEVDDTVITSGFGEVFPKGLVIGTVISRRVGDTGITHTALIRPSASLDGYKLREVFVIEMPEP